MNSLLTVKNLEVRFKQKFGPELIAIRDFNLDLEEGMRIGIVGESGAGKSLLVLAILNLLREPGYMYSGEIVYQGKPLITVREGKTVVHPLLNKIRGNLITIIFQDPMVTLNPLLTIGEHLMETVRRHHPTALSFAQAKNIVLETLERVSIPSPEKRFHQYPHEFSGGMRQRIVIACALITRPKIIIADEPTTALDVTIQAQIVSLLYRLSQEENLSLILITHDLALVSQIAQRVLVMYAGKIVEDNEVANLLLHPYHPYTQGLIRCLPNKTDKNSKDSESLYQIPGTMPSLHNIPPNCAFHPRCTYGTIKCTQQEDHLTPYQQGKVRCIYPR